MNESDVVSDLALVVRYFNNRRPGVFDLTAPGSTMIEISWHSIPCGKVWRSGGKTMVQSPHIKLKRRNAVGRDTIITSNHKKAVDLVDTYIRVPTADAILSWATGSVATTARGGAKEAYMTARNPVKDILYPIDTLDMAEYMVNGAPEEIKRKLLPLIEPLQEAKKVLASSDAKDFVSVAHDKRDDVYYLGGISSEFKWGGKRVTVLPESVMNKLAVLRVCEQDTFTTVGVWDKISDIFDGYYIFGEKFNGENT